MRTNVDNRRRLSDIEIAMIEAHRANTNVVENILVIGDFHEPFSLDGYLEHCVEMYNKHNCNKVVFIGDIIDNH